MTRIHLVFLRNQTVVTSGSPITTDSFSLEQILPTPFFCSQPDTNKKSRVYDTLTKTNIYLAIKKKKKKSACILQSFDLNVAESKNTYLHLTDTQKLQHLIRSIQASFGRDYWKSCLKIKPHTATKVSTDINTADYIWHQKMFWESPHISHKAQLLCSRSLSPSIWSPSLAPWQLPPKEGSPGVQSKRHWATASQMELTGDMAPWAEHDSKFRTDLWFQ